ncbi:sulphite reductase hemo protein, beta subunit [Fistulina hepatica ATCC 64428]|uniref:assimilatory sulfite reductase (NADPH) n=1 Tax=Fistulina hepatica ATCC 64428 TaxID=1128425 RepID=A0A0D7ALZ2_9AGAR|nr:sulphite reductase hemo protein, beta subunit [Fistulina hepatica ATCC 64428]
MAAVSRVAGVLSDVLIYTNSEIIPGGSARLVHLPSAADPGSVIVNEAKQAHNLISFLAPSSSQLAARLIFHLSELKGTSGAVIHLALPSSCDLAPVELLRPFASFLLVSHSAQQAHDNTVLASKLANALKTTVVHAYNATNGDVVSIEDAALRSWFAAPYRPGESPYKSFVNAARATQELLGRPIEAYRVSSTNVSSGTTVILVGGGNASQDAAHVVELFLLSPLPPVKELVPEGTEKLIVQEHAHWVQKHSPIYLEIASAVDVPTQYVALESTPAVETVGATAIPKHEQSYTRILSHVFGDRLNIVNLPADSSVGLSIATHPEHALGRVRGIIERRAELISAVEQLLRTPGLDGEQHEALAQWLLVKDDKVRARAAADSIIAVLSAEKDPAAADVLERKDLFVPPSLWILGSDAWAYDLGASGVHHAIASGIDVNLLIVDANTKGGAGGKRDIGLYAMNHGDVYVASCALYSSYSQVLQSVLEADNFAGPSVVLAYLPYGNANEEMSALDILKETKVAVDTGYWPLYRWNPSNEASPFSLDSDRIKNELSQFLDRENQLSQLTRSTPELASELVKGLGQEISDARRKRQQALESYNVLLSNLNDAPKLRVYYASDGGNAEKLAKRFAGRAKQRGTELLDFATLDMCYDGGVLSSVGEDSKDVVIFITSTAGQGEPPQNGRKFFKGVNQLVQSGNHLSNFKFTVLGMGDSHYWPRPEDAGYYNRPARELYAKLRALGMLAVTELGLGDDQDADGPQTGYKIWEPLVWKALGVDKVEVSNEDEGKELEITNEHIKAASRYLRGTIAEGLQDTTTGGLAPSDGQLTKFHGIYQQDDRDIRDQRIEQGVEPAYSFMIRVRLPGGMCTPAQWLRIDRIADEHGNGTFKITTRQTFQFHGSRLKKTIQAINRACMDTLAACGDVNRNVTCSSIPTLSKLHRQVHEFSKQVSEHLIPRTTAYHEIWLDGGEINALKESGKGKMQLVAGGALQDFEPLYGEFYLPRKFKIAVAVPPTNDVDVFTNDLGFIAIVNAQGELEGFNVSVGGGMGVTNANKKTYPRLGNVIGFCTIEQGKHVAEAIVKVQRDNGNRADRKNARLKYTIDRMGLDTFKAEVEQLLGFQLQLARRYTFDRNVDDYGWHVGEDGRHHFMMYIENGRVQDEAGRIPDGLREIAKIHKGTFRLTTNQHLMLSDIPPGDVPQIKALLAKYGLDNLNHTGLRLSSSACVAFPTCGLAMAESERYLPLLIDKVEKMCEENGLRNDAIIMRMTGCPNGCSRPYVAEVAFVGKALGTYRMLLGGGYYGQRLNKIYRETVTEPEILAILRPMIKRYALERLVGERFGDFTIRAGYIAPTTEGKAWYDRMGGEGEWRDALTAA